MSLLSRLTTWVAGQVLTAANLNSEFNNVVNTLNNLDAGTTSWTTVKTATLQSTSSTTLKGTATNDSASAGNIGEYSTSAVTAVNSASTGQYSDLTSLSLTAGDWVVDFVAHVSRNGATVANNSAYQIGISQTSGNSSTGLSIGDNLVYVRIPTTTDNESGATISGYRQSLSATTTIYAKIRAEYTAAGPPTWDGRLSARRIR